MAHGGREIDGEWQWEEVLDPRGRSDEKGLVAVTQAVAKIGRVNLPGPVQVLGAAVVPMMGLVQGRFRAYLGSVKLWDAAGALAMILRYDDFAVTVQVGNETREVTAEVNEDVYYLRPDDRRRWAYRSNLVISYRDEVEKMRKALYLP